MPAAPVPPDWWAPLLALQRGLVSHADVVRAGQRHVASANVRLGLWLRPAPAWYLTTPGPMTLELRKHLALLRAGSDAALAGETALVLAGLTLKEPTVIQVVAPRFVDPWEGVVYRRVAAGSRTAVKDGLRMVPVWTAAAQACVWARSDSEAETLLRLALAKPVVTADQVRKHLPRFAKRRALVLRVLAETETGATTAAEGLFLRTWNAWRPDLPPLALQERFTDDAGRDRKADASCLRRHFSGMKVDVVVEIDGRGHLDEETRLDDDISTFAAAKQGKVVLRVMNSALTASPVTVVRHVIDVCRAHGWDGTTPTGRSSGISR